MDSENKMTSFYIHYFHFFLPLFFLNNHFSLLEEYGIGVLIFELILICFKFNKNFLIIHLAFIILFDCCYLVKFKNSFLFLEVLMFFIPSLIMYHFCFRWNLKFLHCFYLMIRLQFFSFLMNFLYFVNRKKL